MLSPLRNRFGIPGVISVIALVFAMLGGAYAASNDSGSGKATASAKGKPGPRGPKGKPGPAGPQGPAGPAGPAGAKGDTGSAGSNGSNGTGVTSAAASVQECSEGGTKFTSASGTSTVCNGAEGEEGPQGPQGDPGADGEPWVAGTVPGGKVMKGTWVLPPATAAAAGEKFFFPISTGVPINKQSPELQPLHVAAEGPPFCPGTAEDPQAPTLGSGVLAGLVCVYVGSSTNVGLVQDGNSKLRESGGGAVVAFIAQDAGTVSGYGSWAMGTP